MEEEPEAERMWCGVAARLKMSVGWAEVRVWRVRYCFDCRGGWLVGVRSERGEGEWGLPLCVE